MSSISQSPVLLFASLFLNSSLREATTSEMRGKMILSGTHIASRAEEVNNDPRLLRLCVLHLRDMRAKRLKVALWKCSRASA